MLEKDENFNINEFFDNFFYAITKLFVFKI